jgi:hypothetical protein
MTPSPDDTTTPEQDEHVAENAISDDANERASDTHEEGEQITPDEVEVPVAEVEREKLERGQVAVDEEGGGEEEEQAGPAEDPGFASLMRATELEFERLERERLTREAVEEAEAKASAQKQKHEAEAKAKADEEEAEAQVLASAEEQRDEADVAGDESPTSSDSEPSAEITSTDQPTTETTQEQSDEVTTANDPDDADNENLVKEGKDHEAPIEIVRTELDIEQQKYAAERKAVSALMAQRIRKSRTGRNAGANALQSIAPPVPVDPVNDLALDALVSSASIQKRYEEEVIARSQRPNSVQDTEPEQPVEIEETQAPISIFRKILGLGRRDA